MPDRPTTPRVSTRKRAVIPKGGEPMPLSPSDEEYLQILRDRVHVIRGLFAPPNGPPVNDPVNEPRMLLGDDVPAALLVLWRRADAGGRVFALSMLLWKIREKATRARNLALRRELNDAAQGALLLKYYRQVPLRRRSRVFDLVTDLVPVEKTAIARRRAKKKTRTRTTA